jgi:hypothetical protein
MEWNGMEWNGMEWNGMEWNGIIDMIVCLFVCLSSNRSWIGVGEGLETRHAR